jgi:hypothetical protein
VEELRLIEEKVGYDHAMLYCTGSKGEEAHRHEEALQAYVARRLEDRLSGKVLDRETQVKLRKRMEIRVIAPPYDRADQWATTVIEVAGGARRRGSPARFSRGDERRTLSGIFGV